MVKSPHVLIISTKVDVATDEIVRLLYKRGVRVTRLNTEDYPFISMLSMKVGNSSRMATFSFTSPPLPCVSLIDVSALWYRRVRSAERPDAMEPGVYEFCMREARAALLGSVLALGVRSMSPPEKVWAAEYKPYQLATAMALGLTIPETLITNNPDDIVEAYKRFGGKMIAKPCRTGYVEYGEARHAIYTSQILEEHLSKADSVRLSPTIFQPLVEKQCDVRVTAVGEKLFVAEIYSQSDPAASIDWRRTANPKLPHRVGSLPDEVENRIKSLLLTLGLHFAAIDLIKTALLHS